MVVIMLKKHLVLIILLAINYTRASSSSNNPSSQNEFKIKLVPCFTSQSPELLKKQKPSQQISKTPHRSIYNCNDYKK